MFHRNIVLDYDYEMFKKINMFFEFYKKQPINL